MKNFITIFTPTYNRAYIIEKLYESLKSQTNKNFEWLVIDDGSIDNTEKIFNRILQDDNEFNIRYIKVENGGKHRAINKAVKLAKGTYMFIVDSDDYIVDNAINIIYNWIENICGEKNFAGVSGLRGFNKDTPMGSIECFGNLNYLDKTNIERKSMNSLWDMAEIYKIDILKKFPFPEVEGENFITEGIVWDRIAHEGYKIRWYNEIIYICKYLDDGLTKTGKQIFIDNPKGYAIKTLQDLRFNNYSLKNRLIKYYELSYIANLLQIPAFFLKFIILYAERKGDK